MTPSKAAHSLSYFAAVLSQITATLKDFDMKATAALLEKAKAEIDDELTKHPEKTVAKVEEFSRSDRRL
jgi:hypothetical protein